jgi:isopentenyldiphosphate isomerase
MSDELIDIVDENNQPTGESKMKSLAHQDGSWHRSAHVWIYNSRGEILLQLRSKDKLIAPDSLDVSAAGHNNSGEEIIVSALRELSEELGITAKAEDLKFIGNLRRETKTQTFHNNEFYYVYLMKFDGRAEDLIVQTEEVQTVRFFTVAEIREGLKNNRSKFAQADDYWEMVLDKIS